MNDNDVDPIKDSSARPINLEKRSKGRRRRRRRRENAQSFEATGNLDSAPELIGSDETSTSVSTAGSEAADEKSLQQTPPRSECNTTDPIIPRTKSVADSEKPTSTEIVKADDNNNNQTSDEDKCQPELGANASPIDQLNLTTLITQVNPVRVLFGDRQGRQQQAVNIVDINRRLIERQIEAIQAADSRRWNFDFRNCRPLLQSDSQQLHNPNQRTVTRFNNTNVDEKPKDEKQ